MVIKEYKEFTEEEMQKAQDLWVSVLDSHCRADEVTGNRPCDNGCPCDRCHYDYEIQREYAQALVDNDLPVTPHSAEYLEN